MNRVNIDSILFSKDALVLNETYTLVSDGIDLAKEASSDAIMTVSDSGEAVTIGFCGMRREKNPTRKP